MNDNNKLKIKRLSENAVIPQRATSGSAGYDLSACITDDIVIKPGEIKMIPTGIAAACPKNSALMIYPRSGLASKYGVALANCVGVVDSDYRGEIKIPLINHGGEDFTIESGMRIAQMVVTPVLLPDTEEVIELDTTARNIGGFGSTGK